MKFDYEYTHRICYCQCLTEKNKKIFLIYKRLSIFQIVLAFLRTFFLSVFFHQSCQSDTLSVSTVPIVVCSIEVMTAPAIRRLEQQWHQYNFSFHIFALLKKNKNKKTSPGLKGGHIASEDLRVNSRVQWHVFY